MRKRLRALTFVLAILPFSLFATEEIEKEAYENLAKANQIYFSSRSDLSVDLMECYRLLDACKSYFDSCEDQDAKTLWYHIYDFADPVGCLAL